MKFTVCLYWCLMSVVLLAEQIDSGAINKFRILGLFPHHAHSHFIFFKPILRALAEHGHNVTVLSHFPDPRPPIGYQDVPLKVMKKTFNVVDLNMFSKRRFYDHFTEFFILHEWGKNSCNHTLWSSQLIEVMQSHRIHPFDVILMEQFNSDCMLGVAYLMQIPVIALSSCTLMPWHFDRMGVPIIPSYIPALFLGQSEQMNFMQRLGNWLSFHGLNFLYKLYTTHSDNKLLQSRFGPSIPSVRKLVKNTALMFVNQHYSLSGAKPFPPSVIELGGIHIQKPQVLPKDLQQFLDESDHGVILISWGSLIRAETLPADKREAIVAAIAQLKQRVIWKWENDSIANSPSNLYINKWLPQYEILCHPKIKLFMTHAGLMGSTEAADCGVPVIATPMYGDQFLNAAAMVYRGMGTLLPYEQINELNVLKAVRTTLQDKYMKNARKISQAFRRRPQSALDTAIWWVEYVAASKDIHPIKHQATQMSAIAYYSLDVYFVIAVIFYSIMRIFILLRSKFRNSPQNVNKLKKN